MQDPLDIAIDVTPTSTEFVLSQAREKLLVGPRGEGKTTTGLIDITHEALKIPLSLRPLPGILVRDTFQNYKRTTLKAIMISPLGDAIEVREGGERLEIPGLWTIEAMGIDSIDDINKLQGGNNAFQWFEECAPAAEEDIGAGIQDDAYNFGISSLRYPVPYQWSMITQNYPSEDHWTWERFVTDPIDDSACFEIPRYENPHIQDGVRERWEVALSRRPDLLDRLVYGRPGQVQIGRAVTPEFKRDLHVTREEIAAIEGVDLIMMWDFGLFPSLVIGQMHPLGFLNIPDCLVGPDMGMERFIQTVVKPHMFIHYPWNDHHYRHIAGIEGNSRDQADETTAWDVILGELPGRIRSNIQWPNSLEMVKSALCRSLNNQPWLRISPRAKPLIGALGGGWHYAKNNKGEVLKHKPEKNASSHPADAFAGGVGIISGDAARLKKHRRRRKRPHGRPAAAVI